MLIDICLLSSLLLAILKGMKRGLILAAFSFVGIFIGIAAALKLSAATATWLSASLNVKAFWLPFAAFLLVIIAVMLVVKVLAKLIETSLELTMMGWANRLGGIILYSYLYLVFLSIVLFYLQKMNWLGTSVIASSKSYEYIRVLGPKTMTEMGKLLPFIKDVFEKISRFFDGLAVKYT